MSRQYILAEPEATQAELGFGLFSWIVNFVDTLGGLFISLYILISHDDLSQGCLDPGELSNILNSVLFLPI